MGHSMGSFLVRLIIQEHYALFNGAILVGSGSKSLRARSGRLWFRLMNKFNSKGKSEYWNDFFRDMNNKFFLHEEPNDHGNNWLSVSKKNREAYRKIAIQVNSLRTMVFSHY